MKIIRYFVLAMFLGSFFLSPCFCANAQSEDIKIQGTIDDVKFLESDPAGDQFILGKEDEFGGEGDEVSTNSESDDVKSQNNLEYKASSTTIIMNNNSNFFPIESLEESLEKEKKYLEEEEAKKVAEKSSDANLVNDIEKQTNKQIGEKQISNFYIFIIAIIISFFSGAILTFLFLSSKKNRA